MKISQLIHTVVKLLRLNVPEICFSTNVDKEFIAVELNNNKTLSTLLDCVNYVLDDLACDYAPNLAKGTICAADGFADVSTLEPALLEVIKLSDSGGRNVKFRYAPNGLYTGVDGKLDIVYTARYPAVSFFDRATISNGKIDERVVAYGVAAEYCLLTGDYENMTVWDNRFKNCLASAQVKNTEKTLPARRWL